MDEKKKKALAELANPNKREGKVTRPNRVRMKIRGKYASR